jgi:quercetin dioxygenase-like cupin family protein
MIRNRKRVIASRKGIVAAMVTSALIVGPALATPGSGFQPSPIVNGHFGTLNVRAERLAKWDLHLRTKDDTDIGADRLTVQPQGYSGWHSHPGPVFVTVTQGTVEWYDEALCTAHTYTVGQSYIEPAGRAHDVRNPAPVGGEVAEFIAIVIKPAGFIGPAFRIDERKPNNCH